MTEATPPDRFPVPEPANGGYGHPFLASMSAIPFAVLALAVIFFLYQIFGGVVTYLVMGEMINEGNVVEARWLTLFGQILLILVPTLLLAKGRGGSREVLRVRNVRGAEVLVTLIGILALQQIFQGYMMLQDQIPLPDSVTQLIDPFKVQTYRLLVTAHSVPEFLMIVLVIAVVPAVAEEFLFRGLIQHNLTGRFGSLRAAVLTGLVFAAYHLNPFTFVPLAVLGVYFGYLVHRSGSLTLAIVAHFANNFLACLAVYLGVEEGFSLFVPDGDTSSAMMMLNSVLFVIIFGGSLVLLRRLTAPVAAAGTGDSIE